MVLCLAHCPLSANFLEVWKDNVQNQTSTFMNTYWHKNTTNWTQTLEGTVVSRISSDFLSDDIYFQSWRLSSSTCSRNVWPSRVLWLQWQVWTNLIDEQPGKMCYYVAQVSFEIVLVNDTLWTFFKALSHFHTFMHRQSRFGKLMPPTTLSSNLCQRALSSWSRVRRPMTLACSFVLDARFDES